MKKSILVTGGAKRIGAAIVRKMAMAGFRVVFQLRHSRKEGEDLEKELREAGCEVASVQGSFDTPQEVESLFARALEPFGTLDGLVNNASTFSRSPLLETSVTDFETAWRINTLAPILLTQLLARHVKGRNAGGVVVNLLDQRITKPNIGSMAYLLSKKGLEAFTHSAALELAPYLRVNGVAPGAILVPESPGGAEPAGDFPLKKRPLPEEIADGALYLIRAQSVTGQVLYVDGGQHLN